MSDDVKAAFGITHRTVYTKDNCPACTMLKNTFDRAGVRYTEIKIGRDITREDFITQFPTIKSVPYVVEDANPM